LEYGSHLENSRFDGLPLPSLFNAGSLTFEILRHGLAPDLADRVRASPSTNVAPLHIHGDATSANIDRNRRSDQLDFDRMVADTPGIEVVRLFLGVAWVSPVVVPL
jgi:hypothetical protein